MSFFSRHYYLLQFSAASSYSCTPRPHFFNRITFSSFRTVNTMAEITHETIKGRFVLFLPYYPASS